MNWNEEGMDCCVVQSKLSRSVHVHKTFIGWTNIMETASRGSLSEARPWTSQIISSRRKYIQLSFRIFFTVYWNIKLTKNHEQRKLSHSILESRLTGNDAQTHILRVMGRSFYLTQKLWMCEALLPLPPYALMAWWLCPWLTSPLSRSIFSTSCETVKNQNTAQTEQ
jgi:hypothetical protein